MALKINTTAAQAREIRDIEICSLADFGIKYKDIAKIVGLSEASVGRILVEAGVTRYWTKNVWLKTHGGV